MGMRSHCASSDRRLEVVELVAAMGAVLLRPGFIVEGSIVMTTFVRSPAGSMSMVVRCSYGS